MKRKMVRKQKERVEIYWRERTQTKFEGKRNVETEKCPTIGNLWLGIESLEVERKKNQSSK